MQPRFRRTLLGYNPREVHGYLAGLAQHHQRVLGLVQGRLQRLEADCEATRGELDRVLADLAEYRRLGPTFGRAVRHAHELACSLEEMGRYKAERVAAEAEQELERHRAYLAAVKEELGRQQRRLTSLLEAARTFLAERTAEPVEKVDWDRVAARIVSAQEADQLFATPTGQGLLRVDVRRQQLKVVSRDGQELGTVGHLLVDQKTGQTVGYEMAQVAPGSGLEPGGVVPSLDVVALRENSLVLRQDAGRIRPAQLPGEAEAPPAQQAADERTEPVSIRQQLDQRIQATRMKYLVGKVVGRDLADDQGNLLARRGEAITEELVSRAQSAGKLPELIVHMVLPEMLDEEVGGAG